jgi:hypothetical protein
MKDDRKGEGELHARTEFHYTTAHEKDSGEAYCPHFWWTVLLRIGSEGAWAYRWERNLVDACLGLVREGRSAPCDAAYSDVGPV